MAGALIIGVGAALNGAGWLLAVGTTLTGAGSTCEGAWVLTSNLVKMAWARASAALNGAHYNIDSAQHRLYKSEITHGCSLMGKGMFLMLAGSIGIVACQHLVGPKPPVFDKILGFFGLSVTYPKWI